MSDGVRLDKWLWAARFFKTRGLARDAIDGGKIHIDGVKAIWSSSFEMYEKIVARHRKHSFSIKKRKNRSKNAKQNGI
jgi:ribosomal 50S subunit-recycling heat shock protein